MAEMVAKEPLFKGKAEVDQLDKVSACFPLLELAHFVLFGVICLFSPF